MDDNYTYRVIQEKDFLAWNTFTERFGITYQTTIWANFKIKLNKHIEFKIIGIYQDNILIGGSLIFIYKYFNNFLIYIPWGPLILNNDIKVYQYFLKVINEYAKNIGVKIIKIDSGINILEEKIKELFSNYKNENSSIMPKTIFVMDTTSNEIIDQNIKSKYRGRIRNKGEFKFELYSARKNEINDELINIFYNLYIKTGEIKGFSIREKSYIKDLVYAFLESKSERTDAFLAFVKSKDEYIAASINLACGNEIDYLYSGITKDSLYTKFHPGYYMVHSIAKYATEKGFAKYNLWGGTTSDKKDHMWRGFTDFKLNMGANMISLMNTQTFYVGNKKIADLVYKILLKIKVVTF